MERNIIRNGSKGSPVHELARAVPGNYSTYQHRGQ